MSHNLELDVWTLALLSAGRSDMPASGRGGHQAYLVTCTPRGVYLCSFFHACMPV